MTEKKTAIERLNEAEEQEEEAQAELALAAAKSSESGYKLPLADPIKVDGDEIRELRFRAQRMGDVAKHDGDPVSLVADLASLAPDEVKLLSLYDWHRCLAVLRGFRLRLAAGGQARSSNAT